MSFKNLFILIVVASLVSSTYQEPIVIGLTVLKVVGGVAVATVGVAGAITLAGFTSAGIAAGSIAASIQGPSVAAGSGFAILQSLGATGAIATAKGVGLAALSGVASSYAGLLLLL